jgi:hypothetical protein
MLGLTRCQRRRAEESRAALFWRREGADIRLDLAFARPPQDDVCGGGQPSEASHLTKSWLLKFVRCLHRFAH